jgi:hypothetical protein
MPHGRPKSAGLSRKFAMPKSALTKVRNDDADLGAEAHEKRVATELNAQFEELRDQSQALIAAVKGRRGIQSAEHWQAVFQKAKIDYENGRFLLEQLGAERFLEPELMATLAQLRRELLAGIENPTGADTMMADSAIIAYRNMLRVQAWIGSLCLTVERELFGQAPLNELHGHTVGEQLTQQIARLEEVLMPLLERCHRMMARSFAHLESRRRQSVPSTSVAINQAGQVNVDRAVLNASQIK